MGDINYFQFNDDQPTIIRKSTANGAPLPSQEKGCNFWDSFCALFTASPNRSATPRSNALNPARTTGDLTPTPSPKSKTPAKKELLRTFQRL